MKLKALVPALLGFFLFWTACSKRVTLDFEAIATKLSPNEIESALPNEHPSFYYAYAGRLFGAGDKNAGLRWFYIGQLRYRFHLIAHPNLDPSGDAALFASLNYVVGEQINHYAGEHPEIWIAQIDEALIWDAEHDNGFTSKSAFKINLDDVRAGLVKLKEYVSLNQQTLQAKALGQDPMPKDWPALVAVKTTQDLAGVFSGDEHGLVVSTLFKFPPPHIRTANEFEITAISLSKILVVAIGKNGEVGRKELELKFEDGAGWFQDDSTASNLGLAEGGSIEKIYLRKNTEGDFIMQRDAIIEGTYKAGGSKFKNAYRWWHRASVKNSR